MGLGPVLAVVAVVTVRHLLILTILADVDAIRALGGTEGMSWRASLVRTAWVG
jgi:hypothetical protein